MSKQHLLELDCGSEQLVDQLQSFFQVDDFSSVVRRSLALAKVAMNHADSKGRIAICSDHDKNLMLVDLTK